MQRELKLKVGNLPELERRILAAGGRQTGHATYEYTYFNQPDGHVLKLTKKPEGVFKTVIRAQGDTFDIISSDPVVNEQALTAELTAQFGLKKKLVNHRTFFAFEPYELSLNAIDGLGDFLIIEGQDPSLAIAKQLGIVRPEVITASFDNL